MTAVEWLEFRYKNNITLNQHDFEEAKEMEQKQKQEIRQKSYMEGYDEGLNDALNK